MPSAAPPDTMTVTIDFAVVTGADVSTALCALESTAIKLAIPVAHRSHPA